MIASRPHHDNPETERTLALSLPKMKVSPRKVVNELCPHPISSPPSPLPAFERNSGSSSRPARASSTLSESSQDYNFFANHAASQAAAAAGSSSQNEQPLSIIVEKKPSMLKRSRVRQILPFRYRLYVDVRNAGSDRRSGRR